MLEFTDDCKSLDGACKNGTAVEAEAERSGLRRGSGGDRETPNLSAHGLLERMLWIQWISGDETCRYCSFLIS